MNKLFYFIKLLFCFLAHRPIETIYVNIKLLPLRQALRFPIFVYTKTEFRSINGKAVIMGKVTPNMIHIGDDTRYPNTNKPLSIWTVNGEIAFAGRINFYQGTYVYVAENARLCFGTNGTFVGSNSKVICRDNITIGNSVEITWDVQIYDTSFHYIKKNGECVEPLTKPIRICDNSWIGNNSTITKGVVIPSFSIIASHSLVNSNLEKYGSHNFYAGVPAILKRKGMDRVWDYGEERELDKEYGYVRYKL